MQYDCRKIIVYCLIGKRLLCNHSESSGKYGFSDTGKQIPRKTVARRLYWRGLYYRRPVVRFSLSYHMWVGSVCHKNIADSRSGVSAIVFIVKKYPFKGYEKITHAQSFKFQLWYWRHHSKRELSWIFENWTWTRVFYVWSPHWLKHLPRVFRDIS